MSFASTAFTIPKTLILFLLSIFSFISILLLFSASNHSFYGNFAKLTANSQKEKFPKVEEFCFDLNFREFIDEDRSFIYGWDIKQNTLHLCQILMAVDRVRPLSGFGVNIGGLTGTSAIYDPTYYAFEFFDMKGLVLDPQPLGDFWKTMPQKGKNSAFYSAKVNPDNIQQLIWETKHTFINKKEPFPALPLELDLMKIDIDSFDCDLIQSLLQAVDPQAKRSKYKGPVFEAPKTSRFHFGKKIRKGLRPPRVLIMEMTATIPPPFAFNLKYDKDFNWLKFHEEVTETRFWGCSLAYQQPLLQSYGYELVAVNFWDAIYVHQDYIEEIYPFTPLHPDSGNSLRDVYFDAYYWSQQKLEKHHLDEKIDLNGVYYHNVSGVVLNQMAKDVPFHKIYDDFSDTMKQLPSMNHSFVHYDLFIQPSKY